MSRKLLFALSPLLPALSFADGDYHKVNHIIIVMQENHSFENYFGYLPFAYNTPYHAPSTTGCSATDHRCVDGLTCTKTSSGSVVCFNANRDDHGSTVRAFHEPTRCIQPDLNQGWQQTHQEGNYTHPNSTLTSFPADGFVLASDATEQIDSAPYPCGSDQLSSGFVASFPANYPVFWKNENPPEGGFRDVAQRLVTGSG